MKTINSCGTIPSKIMLVGEAPNNEEIAANNPFSGYTMNELSKCLFEAGIPLQSCYRTHVLKFFPPNGDASTLIAVKKKEITANHIPLYNRQVLPQLLNSIDVLKHEIEACQPNVIIAFGNVALFALTGNWGIMSWRSSLLECSINTSLNYKPKVIPTYSISLVHRMWSWRWILVHDLKRAQKESTSKELIKQDRKFIIRPTYDQAMNYLDSLQELLSISKIKISVDIETKYYHIECIAFALDKHNAICIPFLDEDGLDYWKENEETNLVYTIYKILTHENTNIIGQNFSYDSQYIWKKWLIISNLSSDTMLQQHCIFASAKKDLSFLSSLYIPDHSHWKDEGKDSTGETRWIYNCKDACITYEVDESQQAILKALNLTNIAEFQNKLFKHVQRMIRKGIKFDKAKAEVFDRTLINLVQEREDWLTNVLGFLPNVLSPLQMSDLFYRLLNQKPCYNRSSGSKSVDDKALHVIADREPMLAQLCEAISEIRTINKLLDITRVQLSHDGRFRSNLNIGGTITYRFASSNDAFGEGTNVQNITDGKRSTIKLPNLRELFIPDLNNIYFDADLDSADLRIVAAEAGLDEMFAMLNEGKKVYVEVMKEYFRDQTMTKDSPHYTTFKSLCHGCVTGDHEVLTQSGWIRIDQIQDSKEIAIWDINTKSIHFAIPEAWTRDTLDTEETLIKYTGESYSQVMTFNHRLPYTVDSANDLKQGTAINLPSSARIPKTGFYSGTTSKPEAIMRLYAAFQADGSIRYGGKIRWHFRKDRKIDRIKHLLNLANIPFKEYFTGKDTNIEADWYPESYWKVYGAYLLEYTGECLDFWLDELQHWDGHVGNTKTTRISTIDYDSAQWIQTIAHLRGKGSQLRIHREAEGNRKTLYVVTLNNRTFANSVSIKREIISLFEPTKVYCPQVSTGYFLIRHKGKISVTGNSHYLGTPSGLARQTGLLVEEVERIQKWYYGKFPGLKKWQNDIKDQVFKRKMVQNIFGYRNYIFDRIEGNVFNEAIAWIPQSSIACLVNRALVALSENFPNKLDILQQTHDSLAGQCPINDKDYFEPYIKSALEIELPYDKPIRIPADVHWSLESWGKCK